MLATQMPDVQLEAKDAQDVKQIKEKLAAALKALQKRYVTSDAVVTSEDADANLLCCALEAVFIHGIKAKCVRLEAAAGRSRKGSDRRPLPQPFFWSLLKAVTHQDVITELEKLSFVSTEVGRCRAWLRLALNHGLLECYLASLFREEAQLRTHYRPGALLLHAEERDVLLSYLQGLASLAFSLSYKSAVLNQWTATPLVLAGLQEGELEAPPTAPAPAPRGSWDAASQSSSSSDAAEAQRECPLLVSRGPSARSRLTSSSLSLDTSGSSQLSSSLGSDGPLHGAEPRCPAPDLAPPTTASRAAPKDLGLLQESSQDSLQDDSFVSSAGLDQFSDTALFSSSDSDTQPPPTPCWDQERPLQSAQTPSSSSPSPVSLSQDDDPHSSPSPLVSAPPGSDGLCPAVQPKEVEEKKEACPGEEAPPPAALNRKLSADSLLNSRSWISEDDIYKPRPVEEACDQQQQQEEAPPPAATPELQDAPSPPSVVHRRQIGLSNPFRGLLKLGHLERRGPVGLWRDYYCELSPFEFRLYADAEERACCDNCSLLRCEDARIASPDGRFDLTFPGKRLALRAANRDEAEDWLDRILEAVARCRPADPNRDDQWEVLQPLGESGAEPADSEALPQAPPSPATPPPAEQDWSLAADVERDAIKEAVLYVCGDPEGRAWSPLVFSLSLEAISSFQVEGGRKLRHHHFPVQQVRDVVPDVCVGGPTAFKLLTVSETLRLRAESAQEARSWRALIRGALDSYLDQDQGPESAGSVANLKRLVQHRLGEDGALLVHLDTVPAEKGLDAQGFRCAGCPQKLGLSLAHARLCHFSGLHYCPSCHHGNTSVIPSRMVHNWDLTQRQVSRKALKLLFQVEQEPLLDLQQLNPELLQHAEPMAHTNHLRLRLRLLGDYLLTCRSGACKKLQARMEQRTYLLESSHLYSVADLRQIAQEQYATYLMTLIQFASNHVFHCDLCTQRGFICQVCHADDIIFPFQLDRTTRCRDCKAVFHLSCKSPETSCPRCQRIRKYMERDLQD